MATLIKPQEVVNGGIYRAAPTNARFDINLISPHIASAEERFLIPILGQDMYDDMVSKQNAAISNYNPDAGALVDKFPTDANYETLWTKYLLRFEGYFIYYEVLPYVTIQVGSNGAYFNNVEYGQNIGVQGLKFMQDTTMQKIENLREKIKDFLCDNKADYTLFDDKECPCTECVECDCTCGYWNLYHKPCPTCKKGKNSSSNIIFY